MKFHNGEMYPVSCGQSPVSKHDLFSADHSGLANRQHFIHHPEQSVEGGLNGVAAINRNVTVKNFLKYLGIGNQTLTFGDQLFKPSLGIAAMGMGRAHKIHRDVGIDEDHGCKPAP